MAYNSSYTGAEVDQGVQRASAHASRHATGGADELVPSDIGAAALVSGKVNPSQASSEIVEVTADKTLALTDAGTCQQVNSSSARTITIPLHSSVAFDVGTEIEILRWGTGTVTIAGASGVTIRSANSLLSISDQYASVGLKKMATNTWVLTGSLA